MPAHGPDFGVKMKKKAVKKGTPSAKTLRGRRSAPSKKPRKVMVRGKVGHRMVVKKPFRLEVGKTYENRVGTLRVKIVQAGPNYNPAFAFEGVLLVQPEGWNKYGQYWHENGLYHRKDLIGREPWRDLIREVQPKAPKSRGKKP